jgi:hypothetical protein
MAIHVIDFRSEELEAAFRRRLRRRFPTLAQPTPSSPEPQRRTPRLGFVDTHCLKIRLKPDSIERMREWATELRARPDEVLATLRDEGILVESVFLDSTAEGRRRPSATRRSGRRPRSGSS